MKQCLLGLLLTLLPTAAAAQTNPAAQAARHWRQGHERAIVDEFAALLRIPNVAQDREHMRRNVAFITEMMQQRGIATQLVAVPGANPVVFGELRTPGASRTIVFYAHYDGQPVESKQWATPPFAPTLRNRAIERGGRVIEWPEADQAFDPESRLYARSAGDDKAPIVVMMVALDAIRATAVNAKSNVKFVFDGEERPALRTSNGSSARTRPFSRATSVQPASRVFHHVTAEPVSKFRQCPDLPPFSV